MSLTLGEQILIRKAERMSSYLKKLVSLPVRQLAEYLLDRFLGKFIGKIDLTREGTQFTKDTLTLPDLSLNCRVSQN